MLPAHSRQVIYIYVHLKSLIPGLKIETKVVKVFNVDVG